MRQSKYDFMQEITVPTHISSALARLRVQSNVNQAAVARAMGVDQSKISRIENGETSLTPAEVESYLQGVGKPPAIAYLDYLKKQWRFLDRPDYENTQLDAIWAAEQQLQQLDRFEQKHNPPKAVRGEIDMHRQSLQDAAKFLTRRDHQIAFVGTIGIGKTTALSFAAGLAAKDTKATLAHRVLLETGSGRTTICEVQVKSGPTWGITIDPWPDEEIYRLVGDLCEALTQRQQGTSPEERKSIPQELQRALRNMAGLASVARKTEDGKRRDPAIELTQSTGSIEELRSEFAERLKLWKRTTREIWVGKTEAQPEEWLRQTFGKINKGQLPDVSLPRRVTVILPFDLLDQSLYDLTLIDTRGVDETALRPDIRENLDNGRVLTVLCSAFNSAPDPAMLRLIEHIAETSGERILTERVAMLVLARPGEAAQTKDDTGETVLSDNDGYELKRDHAREALRRFAADVPVLFFNATIVDDTVEFNKELLALIQRLRDRQVQRIQEITVAAEKLITNHKVAAAALVRQDVVRRLRILRGQHTNLSDRLNPAHNLLVNLLQSQHASTIWATTRRQGGWYNFNVYYALGSGAAREAKRRTNAAFSELNGLVQNMLGDPDLKSAHPFLSEVLANATEWKETFLETVHRAAAETFRPALQDDLQFWSKCQERWGAGPGYKDDIGGSLRKWFEAPAREHLHRALEDRTIAAWEDAVLSPLRALCTDGGN